MDSERRDFTGDTSEAAEMAAMMTPEVNDETSVKLRSYQQEMLEASLKRNVIVAMDTGSGKTHVAIFRILAELESCDPSKLIWFLTPSVALSDQQYSAISKHLPGYLIKTLLGSDGVDKWTDQKLWDAVLTNVRVVVGTPAVLEQALTHGFVNISRFALLVFDEAHRCVGKAPMNVIMSQFYHPAKREGKAVPRILGLTASPVMNAHSGDLQTIEANLDSQAITPKRHRSDLEAYVHPPKVSVVAFNAVPANIDTTPAIHVALNKIVDSYDICSDPRYLQLQDSGDDNALRKLEKLRIQPKSHCYKQLSALRQRSDAVLEQLGASATEWYIRSCIERFFEGVTSHTIILPDLSEKENKHLGSKFKSILNVAPTSPKPQLSEHAGLTEKARFLIMTLIRHHTPSTRCIVFVDQRAVVHTLAHLLRQNPETAARYSIAAFVGQSLYRSKLTVADLGAQKDRQKDLDDFRNGQKNLMISTDVLEEGIDVTACNLVICFDAPQNLISFVQRRGRARQKDSHYIIFLGKTEYNSNPGRWQGLEAQMKEAYMDDLREFIPAETVDEAGADQFRYRVESTGAVLTFDNAKAHLYHFCASTLQAGRYVDLRPVFHITTDGTACKAHVQLPSFVHPDLRTATSSRGWRSERTAIKDAAFHAYTALHKAGLLNDNLLPLNNDVGPDEQQIHIAQESVIEIEEKLSPWKTMFADVGYREVSWHAASLRITHNETDLVSILVWLPAALPMSLSFPLYWNDDTTYKASIQATAIVAVPDNGIQIADMRRFTRLVLESIYESKMPMDSDDDPPLLFSAPDELPPNDGEKFVNHRRPASVIVEEGLQPHETGLIRDKTKFGRKTIYVGLSREPASYKSPTPGILVTTFPKRRDFLYRLPRHDTTKTAYSAQQTVPITNCTVDDLPVKYSLLAAFLPSIMHRIEVAFIANQLQRTHLEEIGIKDLRLLCESISSASAGEPQDYNRLEFLGDTVLKFCAVLQVVAQHPHWPEHYLTLEKFRLVNNNYLTRAALRMGLEKYILTDPFTGNKWRPAYVSELIAARSDHRRQVSSKVLADVVEAIIGAAFIDGGVQKGWQWIQTILSEETWYPHPMAISYLLDEVRSCKNSNLELLERLVGHHFKNPALLIEAMTHVTFPQTGTGFSYERLEFLGDAVLDLIVVPHLVAHPRKLRHFELNRLRGALVSSKFLAYCCMSYDIDEDRYDVVQQSGKTAPLTVKTSQRRVHLHDFLRSDGRITKFKEQTLQRFASLRPAINSALESGSKYPWLEFIALKPLKIISDLVESILGALYLDSNGDLGICEAFVENIGLLKHMRRILDDNVQTAFPKEHLGAIAEQQTVEYVVSKLETEDGTKRFQCVVLVGGLEVASAGDCVGAFEAEATAAWKAVEVLEERKKRTGSVKLREVAAQEGEGTMEAALATLAVGNAEEREEMHG